MICHPAPDVWVAQRRDDHATLRSDTPLGLRDAIIADYFARPVSRAVSPLMPRQETTRPRLAPDL